MSHMKIKDSMVISDEQLDVYFNDIDECVDAIKVHQQSLKADEIKDHIKQVKMISDEYKIVCYWTLIQFQNIFKKNLLLTLHMKWCDKNITCVMQVSGIYLPYFRYFKRYIPTYRKPDRCIWHFQIQV